MKRALAMMLLAGFITAGVAPCFADDTKADAGADKKAAKTKKADKKAADKTEKKADDAAKK